MVSGSGVLLARFRVATRSSARQVVTERVAARAGGADGSPITIAIRQASRTATVQGRRSGDRTPRQSDTAAAFPGPASRRLPERVFVTRWSTGGPGQGTGIFRAPTSAR